ncbi:MAG: serine hydrolase domain-containing protein [Gemmatimonadales bacterium]|jgi:CubicO group peptidase (beta-lactamase class C family)
MNRKIIVVTALATSIGSGLSGCARVTAAQVAVPDPRVSGDTARSFERLQALLDSLVSAHDNVRSGVLLVTGPDWDWKGASGVAFEESGQPTLPDDQFVINSVAKMMTATIVMQLIEAGRLGLDDPIARYLPDSLIAGLHVFQGQEYSQSITVRHLLSHTSGIVDDWRCADFFDQVAADSARRWTPEETVRFVKDRCAPEFKPGDGFHYSDTGYNLIGLLLENLTGRPLHELYRTMLLDPLGMEHTYRPAYEAARPSLPGRQPSERYLDDIECTLWPSVMTADWAGGGMVSTTEDLTRFLRAFVRNEIFEDPATRDEMFAWVESGPFHNYGLGISRVLFDRSDNPVHAGLGELWGHAGSSHVFMFCWPREDVTIVGTLNQLAVEGSLYDTLAAIMKAVLEVRSGAPR